MVYFLIKIPQKLWSASLYLFAVGLGALEAVYCALGGERAAVRAEGEAKARAQPPPMPGLAVGPPREIIWHLTLEDSDELPKVGKEGWDLILDVRSPAEYKDDHIPGSISAPVLDNSERAKVGTKYKTDRFTARRIGAALISESIAKLLRSSTISKLKSSAKILVVCWRGGERSHSLATILARVGFKVAVLKGGYQGYRRRVRRYLTRLKNLKYVVISGPTGSGKTVFLSKLRENGAQVIDLEALAGHKGSILGDSLTIPQPSQKMFEGKLALRLETIDEKKTVFIEDEGCRIGCLHVPNELWTPKKFAPRCHLGVPVSVRVRNIREDYDYFEKKENLAPLLQRLKGLQKRAGKENVEKYVALANDQKWDKLVEILLLTHYDKAYAKAVDKYKSKEAKGLEGEIVMEVKLGSQSDYDQGAQAAIKRFCT